jgi:hypothetical protein
MVATPRSTLGIGVCPVHEQEDHGSMRDDGRLPATVTRNVVPRGDRGMHLFELATATIAVLAALVLALGR